MVFILKVLFKSKILCIFNANFLIMDKYLLQILLETNTIIIPTLGALTITDAKSGEMMFMPYLKYDDGKLAAYISEKEGIDTNDAKNLIAKYVREINMKLDQGETYDMFQFGRFLKTDDGEIDFERWENFSHPENVNDSSNDEQVPALTEPVESNEEIMEELEVSATDLTTEESVSHESENDLVTETNTEEIKIESVELEENVPVEAQPSLDAILAQASAEVEEAEPEVKQEISEVVVLKSDPVVDKTPDESKVQVENEYIPPRETIEAVPTENTTKSEESKQPATVAIKSPRKKRSIGFWMLIVLIFVVVSGTAISLLFYDQVKHYLPFLELKRAEIVKRSDSTEIAALLNESAEELEQAEQERVESEANPDMDAPETTSSKESAPAVPEKEIQKPIQKPISKPTPVTQKPAAQSAGNGQFHIIGGAFGEERNANRYAEKLKSSGNNAQVIGKYNGLYLVSIESFASATEASKALQKLETVTGKAWVFKKP